MAAFVVQLAVPCRSLSGFEVGDFGPALWWLIVSFHSPLGACFVRASRPVVVRAVLGCPDLVPLSPAPAGSSFLRFVCFAVVVPCVPGCLPFVCFAEVYFSLAGASCSCCFLRRGMVSFAARGPVYCFLACFLRRLYSPLCPFALGAPIRFPPGSACIPVFLAWCALTHSSPVVPLRLRRSGFSYFL